MVAPDVARTQALAGLSVMSFASLCFQAVWQMAYADQPAALAARNPPPLTGQGSALDKSQFQNLLSKIEALSTAVAQINSSLHSKIDAEIQALSERAVGCNQPRLDDLTPVAIAGIFSVVFVGLWLVGLGIFHHNAGQVSKGYKAFLPRIILLALLAANFGLVVTLVFGSSIRGYMHVLFIVWPVQVTLGWKVLTEKVEVDLADVGEKGKNEEKEAKGEKI
jgi:hypothetical protein